VERAPLRGDWCLAQGSGDLPEGAASWVRLGLPCLPGSSVCSILTASVPCLLTPNVQATDLSMSKRDLLELERLTCHFELAQGLLHEINNSLARVLAHAELLTPLRRATPEKSPDCSEIEGEVLRARKMIQSFLCLSQVGPGFEGPLEMNSLLDPLLSALQDQPELANIRLVRDLSSGSLFFRGNPKQWWILLISLILKAARAMEPGGVLRVSTSHQSTGTFELTIKSSNGLKPGHSTGHLSSSVHPSPGEGRDLTVYLARQVARQAGGSLKVKPSPPEGRTISILLPLSREKQ
jgi:signal transduction histidine kinase